MMGAYTKVCSFIKQHPILTVLIAALVFILAVVASSLYANALVYDYTLVGGKGTGMGIHQSITQALVRYDGNHYIKIAQYGYVDKTDASFFPLYPLLIRALNRVFSLSYDWSAILIAWSALCAAAVVLYKWIELEFKLMNKKVSVWLPLGILAIFPTSFFLVLPYTESLFILFNVLAFYLYRRDKYLLATIFAGLSAATHDQGILLCVFFAVDFLISKKRNYRKLLPIFGCLVGLALYLVFLNAHYGSPLAFLTAEKSWGRLSGNFLVNLINSFRPFYLWYVSVLLIGLASVFYYLGWAYFLYSAIFTLMPLSTGSFGSINRFMLSCLPPFIGLALLSNKIPKPIKLLFVTSSTFLLAWSIMLFANGYWVG